MAGVDQAVTYEASRPQTRTRTRITPAMVIPYAMIVLLLAIWEAISHSSLVTPFMLPTVETVAVNILNDIKSGDVFVNLTATLYRTLVGFGVSAVAGIVLGVLMAQVRPIYWFFDPLISAGFPVPKVALLPVFILWFGLYDLSKITLIIANAIFPVVTATVHGLRSVDHYLIWSARNLGASERRVSWEIVIPAAMPQILTGLQVALPISLIVGIVSEIVMSGDGLGGAMMEAARNLNSPQVFAGIVEIAFAGFCLIKIMEIVRRRLLAWHNESTINVAQ
jgi:ABC-type nitrate/sulfonate/bicarbonate transport system permease component